MFFCKSFLSYAPASDDARAYSFSVFRTCVHGYVRMCAQMYVLLYQCVYVHTYVHTFIQKDIHSYVRDPVRLRLRHLHQVEF